MAAREWGLPLDSKNRVIGEKRHIKDIANYYRGLSKSDKNKFNDKIYGKKRRWRCLFCTNLYTASSLDEGNAKEAYFRAVSPDSFDPQKHCNGDCDVNNGETLKNKKTLVNETSDEKTIEECQTYNCLEFLDNSPESSNTDTLNRGTKGSAVIKRSAKARGVASLVRYYYQNQETAVNESLKIPNREGMGDKYHSIFQPLKASTNQEYRGWQIYYGTLSFTNGLVEEEESIVFNLYTWDKAIPTRIIIPKRSAKWTEQKIIRLRSDFKKAHQFQLEKFKARKENESVSQYKEYIFVLAKPSKDNNREFVALDYQYIYIFSAPVFTLKSSFSGLSVKKITSPRMHSNVVSGTKISNEKVEVTIPENKPQITQVEKKLSKAKKKSMLYWIKNIFS